MRASCIALVWTPRENASRLSAPSGETNPLQACLSSGSLFPALCWCWEPARAARAQTQTWWNARWKKVGEMQPAWLHILPGRQFEGSPEVANWVTDLFWPSIFWPVDTKGRRNSKTLHSIWITFYQVLPSSGWCVISNKHGHFWTRDDQRQKKEKTMFPSNLKIRVNSSTRVPATFSTSLMLTASLCPLQVGSLRSGSTRSLLSLLPVLRSDVIGCNSCFEYRSEGSCALAVKFNKVWCSLFLSCVRRWELSFEHYKKAGVMWQHNLLVNRTDSGHF